MPGDGIQPAHAIACYLMSRRQGVETTARFTGGTIEDVRRHIAEGERMLKERPPLPSRRKKVEDRPTRRANS